MKSKNKYKNKKVIINGIKFDSQKEGERYKELKKLEEAGEIFDLQLQPKFNLLPTIRNNGETLRKITYKADFMYKTKDGKVVVEDVKGFKTEKYRIKKHIFLIKYPEIEFREV